MITFIEFLHDLTLLGVFILAFYCVWIPLMWIIHDLWLDRYRAKQVLSAIYRDGGYDRIEEEWQREITDFCENRLQLNTKVGFRVMNSTIGIAYSIGNDVWLPNADNNSINSNIPSEVIAANSLPESTATSVNGSRVTAYNQTIELTDLMDDEDDEVDDTVDDGTGLLGHGDNTNDSSNRRDMDTHESSSLYCTAFSKAYEQLYSTLTRWITTNIAWALRHIVIITYRLDQSVKERFPNHPLVLATASQPYQCVIGIAPVVFSTDRFVSMWLLKRRLYFVKYNTGMSRGIIMMIQYVLVILVNSRALMDAFTFNWLGFHGFFTLLLLFASFPVTQVLLDNFHHARADRFANRFSTIDELKGAIRYIDAESQRNDICKFFCLFIFAGVFWPSSRSNAVIRIAKIKLLLKQRYQQQQQQESSGERDSIDDLMDTPQYAEQLHRMKGMLDHSIMSVIEERREVSNIFASPLDSWYSGEIRFRGQESSSTDFEQGTATSTAPGSRESST